MRRLYRAPLAVSLPLTLALATLLSCGPSLLGPDFEDDFDHLSACGDVVFYAVDGADEVMLTFESPGPVASAQASGDTTTTVFTLPDSTVTLIVEQGSRVSDATCDDVLTHPGPRVDRTWRATAGTATVTIRPGEQAAYARGDLILDDVVFTDRDGNGISLERLRWLDVSVGWLPG